MKSIPPDGCQMQEGPPVAKVELPNELMADEILFEADTPLGFRVRVTQPEWDLIATIKHPVLLGREYDVQKVLQDPDEIRRSVRNPIVYLFYRMERPGRWLCVVAKKLDQGGSIITAYPTDAIKRGEHLWSR